MNQSEQVNSKPTLLRGLSLMDSIVVIIGGTVGSGIFLAVSDVAENLTNPLVFLGVWVLGGFITLLACFAFAELGTMYPAAGGQYIYIREAFGGFVAFLFGWMSMTVNFAASGAALTVGFATYLNEVVPFGAENTLFSIAAFEFTRLHLVALLTLSLLCLINVVGLKRVTTFHDIATWTKFAAIALIVVLGIVIGTGHAENLTTVIHKSHPMPVLLAVLLALNGVFWAYDGWTCLVFVAGEIKNPKRNIPLALVIGVLAISLLYVGINSIYLYAVPLSQIGEQRTIAKSAAVALFSPAAGWWVSLLIAVSCLGTASVNLFAGARIVYAMAADGIFFPKLSYIHPRYRTPSLALIVLAIWSGLMALSGEYEQLYTLVMFGIVVFYIVTVVALFVLRRTQPDVERPYRCTGYPVLPAIYIIVTSIWAVAVAYEKPVEALAGTIIVVLGAPLYFYWKKK